MDEFTIAIALWDGVEELDFAGPYEVLDRMGADERTPDQRADGRVVDRCVRCSHGLRVMPDSSWDDVGKLDLLVLPGGDTRPLQADETFLERMRTLAAVGDADDERLHRRPRVRARRGSSKAGARRRTGRARPARRSRCRRRPGVALRRRRRRSSPPRASQRGSTWRCTSSRGSSPSSARRRYAATSSTTRSRRSERGSFRSS